MIKLLLIIRYKFGYTVPNTLFDHQDLTGFICCVAETSVYTKALYTCIVRRV